MDNIWVSSIPPRLVHAPLRIKEGMCGFHWSSEYSLVRSNNSFPSGLCEWARSAMEREQPYGDVSSYSSLRGDQLPDMHEIHEDHLVEPSELTMSDRTADVPSASTEKGPYWDITAVNDQFLLPPCLHQLDSIIHRKCTPRRDTQVAEVQRDATHVHTPTTKPTRRLKMKEVEYTGKFWPLILRGAWLSADARPAATDPGLKVAVCFRV